jgi:hypothetical protein
MCIHAGPLDEERGTDLGGAWVCIAGMLGRGTWGEQGAPGPSGWCCRGRPGRGLARRTEGCQGARVRMPSGREGAAGVTPPGGRVSPGGPVGGQGRERITPSTPWPPGGQGCPARRGGHQQSGGGLSRAGAVGGGADVGPARALALGQAGTRAGPPPPIVPALVAALGPHVRQDAADTRLGGARPGGPTLGRRGVSATADLALRHGAQAVVGARAAVDIPAQGRPDGRWAGPRRRAGDPPPVGPDRRGPRPSGAFRTPPLAPPSAPAPREGLNRPPGGRTGGPPVGSVRGDATGGDQAVDGRLGGQGTGPGGQHTPPPSRPPPYGGSAARVRRAWAAAPSLWLLALS